MKNIFAFGICILLLSCNNFSSNHTGKQDIATADPGIIQENGESIARRFMPPQGYHRIPLDSNSFGFYLRHLALKQAGSDVYFYNGRKKGNSHVAAAVVDMDIGEKDLQQCADAVIRLRAEYLRNAGRENEIVFNFTNGTPASWPEWKEGKRCFVNGNQVEWRMTAGYSNSYENFRSYLETVFMYAGSLSLENELHPAGLADITPGNVFIQGGSPGHAVIVVDVAENENGEIIFMLAQSYMPAQDIHVLVNLNNANISPWYRLKSGENLTTPEWVFEPDRLKQF
ncbi:MAG: DUF4846 domain-containing protein [Bacteroidetes bacterium]|nr:DUF4846 domain-containing protein [Bacteroidota bacterium]